MNINDYRERLGISFSDKEKAVQLRNKIINLINFASKSRAIANEYFDRDNFYTFFGKIGEIFEWSEDFDYDAYKEYDSLINSFNKEKNIEGIIWKFVILINVNSGKIKKNLLMFIKNALSDLNIQYEIIKDVDGCFIFPKGARELDAKLVSEPLDWLNDYPISQKVFINALKDYAVVDENTASLVADEFRKALETFFQEFFKTEQSLENCKSIYGKYMKDKGVSAYISNNFETILQLYVNFNNNNAKHHDKVDLKVLEFILYQTGLLIRTIIVINAMS